MSARVWCWTPNPVLETKFTEGRRIVSAGGKGHNVARQLRRWGVPAVSVVSRVGGDWLQAVRQEKVLIREIPMPSAARQAWSWVPGPGKRVDFFAEDPKWKKSHWDRCALFFRRNLRKGDWLVVAGSVPTGARQGWWRNLFLELQNQGARIVIDGKGQLLREALAAGVEWAKGNLAEVEETMSRKGEGRCLAVMQKISKGNTSLMVTLGSRGLVAWHGSRALHVPATKIRLRDATGSGDVATASVIFGLLRGWPDRKIARLAARMASRNAAREDVGRVPFRG